jgi:hypothetical protein
MIYFYEVRCSINYEIEGRSSMTYGCCSNWTMVSTPEIPPLTQLT